MDSFGDCSYTKNGASPPQAQMTSADRKAAEAKAAETLQIRYYDPNNQRKSKFKHHLTSGEFLLQASHAEDCTHGWKTLWWSK